MMLFGHARITRLGCVYSIFLQTTQQQATHRQKDYNKTGNKVAFSTSDDRQFAILKSHEVFKRNEPIVDGWCVRYQKVGVGLPFSLQSEDSFWPTSSAFAKQSSFSWTPEKKIDFFLDVASIIYFISSSFLFFFFGWAVERFFSFLVQWDRQRHHHRRDCRRVLYDCKCLFQKRKRERKKAITLFDKHAIAIDISGGKKYGNIRQFLDRLPLLLGSLSIASVIPVRQDPIDLKDLARENNAN